MYFEFQCSTRIIFGSGTARCLPEITASFGKRIMIVTGSTLRPEGLIREIEKRGSRVEVFHVSGEPDIAAVNEGAVRARACRAESVIAIGGGSAIDAGKAVSALITNEGDLLDYLEVVGGAKPLQRKAAPWIAVPTTAGTGAEVTTNAVIGVPEEKVKVSLRSPLLAAAIAVVDPELTLSNSPQTIAFSGMDALTQLIEGYVSRKKNPYTDALCLEGIKRAANSLEAVYEEKDRVEPRENMALAGLLSGIVLSNAKLGAVHGFAGPIGGMFPAPHGAVCASLLPFVMAANMEAAVKRGEDDVVKRYETIASLLCARPGATASDGIGQIKHLCASLSIPSLSKWGIRKSDFPEIIEKAERSSSMQGNPVELSRQELAAVLENSLISRKEDRECEEK